MLEYIWLREVLNLIGITLLAASVIAGFGAGLEQEQFSLAEPGSPALPQY